MISAESGSYKTLEQVMADALNKSGYITHVMKKEIFGDISEDVLNKFCDHTFNIRVKDNGIIAVNDDGEEIFAPDYGVSIENDGKWLSELITDPEFDLDMGGNLRKSIEATNAYIVITVANVLNDIDIINEVKYIISNYDFKSMKPLKDDGTNFTELLNDLLSLQSYSVNVIVSAAKIRIANQKKDTAKFLKDGIPEDLEVELRNLDIKISNINRNYSNGPLSPDNVKKLEKIEILTYLSQKQKEIDNVLNQSVAKTLYKIQNLSTEYVSPLVKRKLSKLALIEVEKFYTENPQAEDVYGDMSSIVSNWKSRYYRLARMSVRREEVIKFLELGSEYVLPVKA